MRSLEIWLDVDQTVHTGDDLGKAPNWVRDTIFTSTTSPIW